jgi:hypothetical protein
MLNYPRENEHSEEKSWHTWDNNGICYVYFTHEKYSHPTWVSIPGCYLCDQKAGEPEVFIAIVGVHPPNKSWKNHRPTQHLSSHLHI